MQKLQKGDSKLLNAWAFYDWANSVYALVISSTIFPLYYGALFRQKNIEEIIECYNCGLFIKKHNDISITQRCPRCNSKIKTKNIFLKNA